MSSAACKKKSDGVSSVSPPKYADNSCYMWGSTLTGAQADACCSGGVPKASPPKGSCPESPGFTPTASTMSSFTSTANTGKTALAVADALVGKTPTAANNSSAATAGDNSGGGENPNLASLANPLAGNLLQAPASGAKRAAGGSGGSGGGGGMDFKSVTTAAMIQTAEQQLASTETGGAAYGGGGAGGKGAAYGGGGGAGGDLGSLFGNNGNGAKGGIDSLDLGGRKPASDAAMGSADPDDYFQRLRPGDSIFLVVERRYGAKAKGWALRDAAGAAETAKRLSR